MSLAKKLKMIVKGERKPTFGTDPNEPWSVRAGITESETSMLGSYLKSRGINPEFVSKDTKISHAKSSEFSKWKRDHNFDDPADYVSSVVRDKMKSQREELEIKEAKTTQGTALDKFRQAAAERARKHDDFEREMKARHAAGKEDMKGSIDRLEKQLNKEESVVNEMDTYPHPDSKEGKALMKAFKSSAKKDPTDLNAPGKSPTVKQTTSALLPMLNKSFKKSMKKEETINEVSSSEVEHHFHNWTNSEHAPYNSDAGDDNKVHQSALRYLNSTNVPKENHEKLAMHIAHKFHGSGIYEESKPITELKKSTVFSWLKQQPVVPVRKPGTDKVSYNQKVKNHSKSWNRALDRLSGYKPTSEAAGINKTKETQFHKKLDTLVHNTFGKRKDELKMKEEVVTEKNDSHTHAAHYEDPKTGEWTGMNLLIAKDDEDAIRQANEKCKEGCRLTKVERHITVKEETIGEGEITKTKTGLIHRGTYGTEYSGKGSEAATQKDSKDLNFLNKTRTKNLEKGMDVHFQGMKEDVFQDTQAATQTAFDMGTTADQTEPTYSRKKEMSKSARMIKSLYKKHRMVKEDLYDHEKEDKSVAPYGKKPKVEIVGIDGDEDNQAAMVLKGGKTLTGQERDTLEIDPVMRKPTSPEIKNSNKKTDK